LPNLDSSVSIDLFSDEVRHTFNVIEIYRETPFERFYVTTHDTLINGMTEKFSAIFILFRSNQ
jgi:hypothetical protein